MGGLLLQLCLKPMKKVCASVGCKKVTTSRYCHSCKIQEESRRKENAKSRARSSAKRYDDKYKKFYGSSKWKELRTNKLKKDPLCEDCKSNGFIRAGMDVDHIVEIKDDFSRRLDMTNLKTLCRSCHVAKTSRARRTRIKNSSSNENRWI